MEIAYIISAYQYPEHLVRLVERLHTNTTSFFIHIDKKTNLDVYTKIVQGTKNLPGVHFLKRHLCYWGGFGHVQATLEGIHEILMRDIPFEIVILLTGQDYPIKSNEYIHGFMQKSKGKSFMNFFPLPSDQWLDGGLQRIDRWHIRLRNRHLIFPKNRNSPIKRKFPSGAQPYGGSSYWCLTRECIEYIYKHIQEHPSFVNFFRWVDVPDELFFQTVLLNSPLRETIINDDLRYIEWRDPESGSPAVLGKDDLEKMMNSPKLFARKFGRMDVLDMIDCSFLSLEQR